MLFRWGIVAAAAFLGLLLPPRDADASCSASREQALWKNDDPTTSSITRIEVRFVCQDQILNGEPYPPGPSAYVHVLGKCKPVDCEWGEAGATRVGDYLYAVYDHGFAKRFVWLKMSNH